MNNDDLKPYLFVLDSTQMSRDDAIKVIDGIREIENWQKILPDATVLISRLSMNDLQKSLVAALPGQRYLLVPIERYKKTGWLAKSSWEFMNNPTSVFTP